jgi:dTDP-glucose pyrophosphorylase
MIVITDLTQYACSPKTPIREVMVRLDRSPYLFQIVVDDAGRLIGTVTDGDIRRAMLQGMSFDENATACMQTRPRTGNAGDQRGNQMKLASVGSSRSFLPVLDSGGKVTEIMVRDEREAGIAHALVMAGGFGKRLGERTKTTPKPLLPVGGKPILEYVLAGLEKSSVRTIYVSVHFKSEQIRRFLDDRANVSTMHVIEETEPLGTAGALGLLRNPAQAPLLVVNGDVITDVDFSTLHEYHVRHALDATIGVTRYDVDVPFGVVRYSREGLFDGIDEKPKIINYIAAGVYYLSSEIFGMVPGQQQTDMPELLNQSRAIGRKIGLFPIHEYWTDVGRSDDLAAADAEQNLRGTSAA